MKKFVLYSLLGSFFLLGCQSDKPPQTETKPEVDLTAELPGTWETVSIKVNINSFNNLDTNMVFEIKEEQWEPVYRVRPSRTYFELDNQYRQEFRSITDSLISVNRGVWNVFTDTLMLIEPDTTYQFVVSVDSGMARFHRLVDWDGDGEADDDYLGVHRRVSRTTED